MNALFKVRKDMHISTLVPFRYVLYLALLSDVSPYQEDDDDTRYGIYGGNQEDLYDFFSDWTHTDSDKDEVLKALEDLQDEGLISFHEDDDGTGPIFLGTYRGRKFFTFEVKNSIFDMAMNTLKAAIKQYGSSSSAKDKSRSRFIRERITEFEDRGIDNLRPSDFTDLHGYVYEVYTGGEIYNIRNKVEHFQTTNMLKAYDKYTVFALIVEGTLNFDKYRKKGTPTLTTVACIKDDVFGSLNRADKGSKEYMRKTSSPIDDSDF